MWITVLPLVAIASPSPVVTPMAEVITTPRVAQVRLAETLADASAIEAVRSQGRKVTFAIVRGDETFDVVATTRKQGDVVALTIAPTTQLATELQGLSWLATELAQTRAVIRLHVDDDGAVTLTTDEGQRYMAIPGRGSGGASIAVESRWAAAWSSDGS